MHSHLRCKTCSYCVYPVADFGEVVRAAPHGYHEIVFTPQGGWPRMLLLRRAMFRTVIVPRARNQLEANCQRSLIKASRREVVPARVADESPICITLHSRQSYIPGSGHVRQIEPEGDVLQSGALHFV